MLRVSRKFYGCFKIISRELYGCFNRVPCDFKEVQKMLRESFNGFIHQQVSWVFQEWFKEFSRQCQGCFKCECFKGVEKEVSKVFQGCFMVC